MRKYSYTVSTETTEVTETAKNQVSDALGEEQEVDFQSLLVLVEDDHEHHHSVSLSSVQQYIALQSILHKGENAGMETYCDERLLQSKDRSEPLNHLLYSIDKAIEMLDKLKICGGLLIFHPKRDDENVIRLSVTQAAVLVARLGIRLDEDRVLNDEVLQIIYGPDWKPQFDPDFDLSEVESQLDSRSEINLDDLAVRRKPETHRSLTAKEIKDLLDKTIIGQDEAKETLAAALYEQELNDRYNECHRNDRGFIPLKRKNMLIYGPSGTGKTAIIKKVSEILDKPVVIFDASSLTPSGYNGGSTEEILQELLDKAEGDVEKASHGIVYLDECDKCFLGASGNSELGSFKGSVAYELLRILDGCKVSLGQGNVINTANVQFILGGAFPYLDDIIRMRISGSRDSGIATIGFQVEPRPKVPAKAAENDILPDVTIEDLKAYGLPSELLGRISVICRLKKLTKENLIRILSDSDQSPLKQYRQKLSMVNVSLEMTPKAMETVAELALERRLGARGLEYFLREALKPVMFSVGNNRKRMKLELKPECFTQGTSPAVLPVPRKRGKCKV